MHVYVADEDDYGDRRISSKSVLAVGEAGVLKCLDCLVAEGGVHPSTLFLLIMGLFVIPADPRFFDWRYPHWYGGCLVRVGWSDKGDQDEKGVLGRHQEKAKVSVLPLYEGSLN